jgi:hypothetical protein
MNNLQRRVRKGFTGAYGCEAAEQFRSSRLEGPQCEIDEKNAETFVILDSRPTFFHMTESRGRGPRTQWGLLAGGKALVTPAAI